MARIVLLCTLVVAWQQTLCQSAEFNLSCTASGDSQLSASYTAHLHEMMGAKATPSTSQGSTKPFANDDAAHRAWPNSLPYYKKQVIPYRDAWGLRGESYRRRNCKLDVF